MKTHLILAAAMTFAYCSSCTKPHGNITEPNEIELDTEKRFGIGAAIGMTGEIYFFNTVGTNSPAARAGLLPGDRIESIDGHFVTNKPIKVVVEMLRGTSNSVMTLKIQRKGSNGEMNALEFVVRRQSQIY